MGYEITAQTVREGTPIRCPLRSLFEAQQWMFFFGSSCSRIPASARTNVDSYRISPIVSRLFFCRNFVRKSSGQLIFESRLLIEKKNRKATIDDEGNRMTWKEKEKEKAGEGRL